ncbi:hypothetical protein [Streptomyces sp. KHY 26]|uniref:hypothetical protein n=1 Tax=Streptomyces sp. KHY 26 TaxID=3097359 RepID=UPI00376EFB43
MAERNGGDGPPGHRHGTLDVEARLGAALRAYHPDPEAEHRAVAAFRTARTPGARPPRTRPRDDWRPASPRRSLRTALSLALASLALGGVATAAIGVSGSREAEQGVRRPHPSTTATPPVPVAPSSAVPPSTATPPPPAGSGPPAAHPVTVHGTRARCQAFGKAAPRGHALDATAWQQLVAEAGGQEEVAAYCAARNADRPGETGAGPTRGDRKK